MGEHFVDALAVGDAHHLQQLDGAGLDIAFGFSDAVVQLDDLVHLVADAEHRVQGGHGLLEDHGHRVAADVLHLFVGHFGDVIGFVAHVQADGAFHHLALGPLQKLHQRQAGDRLAAAGLAHDAHRLADGHIEGDAIHGLDGAGIGEEIGVQVVKLHRVVGVAHLGEVFGFGHVFALALLFVLVGDPAVLAGDPAGFFRRKIAFLFSLSHVGSSFLSASSWGRRRRADRRPPG